MQNRSEKTQIAKHYFSYILKTQFKCLTTTTQQLKMPEYLRRVYRRPHQRSTSLFLQRKVTKSAIILIHENIKDKTQTFIYELSVFTDKKKRNVKVKHAISEVFDILKIVLDDWSFIYYDLVLTTIAPEYIFLCL